MQRYAILVEGPPGAGKSTMCKLISKYYNAKPIVENVNDWNVYNHNNKSIAIINGKNYEESLLTFLDAIKKYKRNEIELRDLQLISSTFQIITRTSRYLDFDNWKNGNDNSLFDRFLLGDLHLFGKNYNEKGYTVNATYESMENLVYRGIKYLNECFDKIVVLDLGIDFDKLKERILLRSRDGEDVYKDCEIREFIEYHEKSITEYKEMGFKVVTMFKDMEIDEKEEWLRNNSINALW
ncbi:hypothetical protein P9112_013275 [Eukaryota sp. TZLM1-RC]